MSGVTESLIETFGEVVFGLSHNHQVRRGDPVRRLDYAEVERQRPGSGLTDAQIAARIGLARQDVRAVRLEMERRRFDPGHRERLNALGGGRRYRPQRMTTEARQFDEPALALRRAMPFDPALARRYLEAGWWRADTLGSLLAGHAAERPEAVALEWADGAWTWAELEARTVRLAASLRGLGVQAGDVVAVQLPNAPEDVVTFLAIAWLGAVMTTIYMPYREAEIEAQLAHSRARVLVCPAAIGEFEAAAAGLAMQGRLGDLEHVVALGGAVPGATDLAALMEAPTGPLPADAGVASDPYLLLYTSGTTARPKAVPLSYHLMLSNGRLAAALHGIGADDVILSAPPFGHLFGLYALHMGLNVGAGALLLESFTPPALADTIAAGRPTVLTAAPAHAAASLGLFAGRDVSSLRAVIMSGAAVPADLARGLEAALPGAHICQLWGMTELQNGALVRPGDGPGASAVSSGRACTGNEVRVVTAEGAVAAAGEEGELQVRGCSLFPGYFGDAAATRAAFAEDGWFRSGDLARLDGAGNVTITGRLKDVINRGGVKYNPLEVEALLDRHPAIAQSAIVPMPDPVLGERACCFVVAAGDAAPSLDQICAYLAGEGIAKTKFPERLEVVAEMPLTPTRKVIKDRLQLHPG